MKGITCSTVALRYVVLCTSVESGIILVSEVSVAVAGSTVLNACTHSVTTYVSVKTMTAVFYHSTLAN